MSRFTKFRLEFENNNTAFALRDVPPDADPTKVLEALQLPQFKAVIT